ncbi:MAG: cytidylate kinase [Candidatus Pacebacteria bacterium CG10_big_fil_rev_8_21_14_0_10_56_10]|nr:MAG: cytidylate kinase [Candidatus Pacebacteria bacterium CG10_big_fil_rev_8_21_14_0_10_56_10]
MSPSFHIAIDGPVAAGKGTVSRLVANRLGFVYIDTGAMYRTAALLAQRRGVSLDELERVTELVKQARIDVRQPRDDEQDGRLSTVTLDDEDVSWQIRTLEIGTASSQVGEMKPVRAELVRKQQQIAVDKNVIMEGRDITYRVLPDADVKIYLTASEVVRAKRRHQQLLAKGIDTSFDEVYQQLMDRDQRDTSRAADPLQIVDEAWVVDTTDLTIDQVVTIITSRVQAMIDQHRHHA